MTRRKIEYWVIPPEQDAEFVANMEEVLETYAQACDAGQPVVCMDEQPIQLLKETRMPIAATKEHGERVDYEYERNGTADIFMFAKPLSGFSQATAREQRTKAGWAIELVHVLDTHYAGCARITLICDNLNTHTKGAFYTAFPPEQARAYIKRIHFCYTPKHGSWLNVAECELSCLTSQCLSGRRIGKLALLQAEIGIWADKTNARQRGVDWQYLPTHSILSAMLRLADEQRFCWQRRMVPSEKLKPEKHLHGRINTHRGGATRRKAPIAANRRASPPNFPAVRTVSNRAA